MSDSEERDWNKRLAPDQYHILREKGTEPPFSGKHVNNKDDGMYSCAGCGQTLFSSETKYDSGSGWPSFYSPSDKTAVETHQDNSHGMIREEIKCANCGGHLGHVFPDGPQPTGMRYCINSAALNFSKKDSDSD